MTNTNPIHHVLRLSRPDDAVKGDGLLYLDAAQRDELSYWSGFTVESAAEGIQGIGSLLERFAMSEGQGGQVGVDEEVLRQLGAGIRILGDLIAASQDVSHRTHEAIVNEKAILDLTRRTGMEAKGGVQ